MLRTLIVEDDFVGRKILHALLSPFGVCDVAVNGEEALEAFTLALRAREPYHLICLDINMPGINGHDVLAEIRSMEDSLAIQDRTKVIMTTGSSDPKDVRSAFRGECDAYLIKPIEKGKLLDQLRDMGLQSVIFG